LSAFSFRDWFYDPPHRQILRIFKVGRRNRIFFRLKEELNLEILKKMRRMRVGPQTAYEIHALLHPDRLALSDPYRELTYIEAAREVNRLRSSFFHVLNISPGDRVLFLLENRCEYPLSLFALYGLGASPVHGSFRATAREIAYLVHHSEAKAILASERSFPEVERFLKESGKTLPVISLPHAPVLAGGYSYEELLSRGDPGFNFFHSDSGMNFVYTSGTTGKPKGAYRHVGAISPMDLFRILETVPFWAGERHLVISPLYHSGAQAFAYMEIGIGATLVLLPEFDPLHTLKIMAEKKIESVFMVPTMISRLLNLSSEDRRLYFPQDLRVLISGAAPFPHSLRLQAIEWLGAERLYDFYGATELGWVTTISGREMIERPGSVGKPIGGCSLRILDEKKNPLPPRKIGVIYVRSPTASAGYWKDPESTSRYRLRDYFTVEDLGYLDEDGYLYLQGRARDMIISGGVNIYPAEIEEILDRHPGVKESSVVGIADPEWGEKVVAVVVLRSREVEPRELIDFLRQNLASYKIPKEWYFWEELPRNPTGKVVKREIVARLSSPQK
jgi:fatty-acyl-CoA synthase